MQTLQTPRDLVTKLLAVLSEHAGGHAALSSDAELGSLLDNAWFATLLEEEGRRTTFTLGYVSPGEAHGVGERALAFAAPTPLAPASIAKLAPATLQRETIIGVQGSRNGVEIWGLVHLGDRTFDIDQRIRPQFLQITGFRPGGLIVEFRGQRLVLYMNGIAHWYDNRAQNITNLLGRGLDPTADALGALGGALAHEFERLADRLVLAGQGGTLLVAHPTDDSHGPARPPIRGVQLPGAATFDPPDTSLRDAFRAHERGSPKEASRAGKAEESLAWLHDAERKHASALDHVARLANVDGAVVMCPDLSVLGFKATIEMDSSTEMPPIDLIDPSVSGSVKRAFINDFAGHRHKAALHFCATQRRFGCDLAFAVVASQDGPLSLFGLASTGIAVYQPFILGSP